MNDLRKCDLLVDGREKTAQERATGKGTIKMMTGILNEQLEASEKERKDVQRRVEGERKRVFNQYQLC